MGLQCLAPAAGSHTQHWLQYTRNHAETETNGPCNVAAALLGATMSQHTSQLFTMEPIYINVRKRWFPSPCHVRASQEEDSNRGETFQVMRNAQWNRKDTTKDLL